MATEVKCPSCGHHFEPNEAIREEVEKELRLKVVDWQKKKDEEFAKKLEEEKQLLGTNIRKTIAADFENKLQLLESSNKESEEKLKLSRQKELEFLKKEQDLKTKEEELEISVQKKLQEERANITEQIRKHETEKTALKETEHNLRVKELEKQLDDQKKLAEEMKRKAEQGSMQLQGEVQELILEELLRSTFPYDVIGEVGKGVRGADCIQLVRNNFGQDCGKIIYESKRTKDFSIGWIEKLKKDMRSSGIDVAIIVTQCYPKGMDCFGERDGVWICSFEEVKAVAYVLRDGIIKVSTVAKFQEHRGDKMHLLYDYLTGTEFAGQWKAISEGFMSMRQSIQVERNAMEKLWKAREKQLDKVLLNAVHISGSVEGIAGKDTINLSLTNDNEDEALFLE